MATRDNSTANSGSMTLNDHNCLLDQLSDMFGHVASLDLIRSVCEFNNWERDMCIDQLIKNFEYYGALSSIGVDRFDSAHYPNSDLLVGNPERSQIIDNTNVNEVYKSDNISHTINKRGEQMKFVLNEFNWHSFKNLSSIPMERVSSYLSKEINDIEIDWIKVMNNELPKVINTTVEESHEVQNILRNIQAGYKIIILMRGAPGSGKSYLARKIIDRSIKGEYKNHIFSSDDYFYDMSGRYVYRKDKLQEAHKFNLKRVQRKVSEGWSPIIVDNTNIKVWEMIPYAKYAVEYGYLLVMLRPNYIWTNSAEQLAIKNQHGVTKDKIRKMLECFEPITPNELLKGSNLVYKVPLPQLRLHPRSHLCVTWSESTIDGCENRIQMKVNNKKTNFLEYLPPFDESTFKQNKESLNQEQTKPKPTRDTSKRKRITNTNIGEFEGQDQSEENIEWKSYEGESSFHNCNMLVSPIPIIEENYRKSKPQRSLQICTDNRVKNLSVLEQEEKISHSREINLIQINNKLQKHKIGCRNENKSFAIIRQIYSHIFVGNLWDLFEKCNGESDRVVDILLKSDISIEHIVKSSDNKQEYFSCQCDEDEKKSESKLDNKDEFVKSGEMKPLKLENKKCYITYSELLEAEHKITENFISADNNLKGKSVEKKCINLKPYFQSEFGKNITVFPKKTEKIEKYLSSESETDEIIKINFGIKLIDQLEHLFGLEPHLKYTLSDFKTDVFMPKKLAQQLHVVWMESLYNQIEEQKQNTLKKDEAFARNLEKSGTYVSDSLINCKNIMKSELSCNVHKCLKSLENSPSKDIATHLTHMKLCEIFPNIDASDILKVHVACGNKFADTVDILGNSVYVDTIKTTSANEQFLVRNQSERELAVIKENTKKTFSNLGIKPTDIEESKKLVLRDFEASRNLAVHHSQLKAECYQKAKEALQKTNTSAAVYYSQIATLHRDKINMYNHKAANCIVEAQSLVQDNPDFIDLHYLHIVEAIEILDLFIDKHITKIKNIPKSYKHIFIITGRGLHSTGGISTIKNKVKYRLKERNLKWSEVNPGLLKVKIFSASKYTKNI